MFEYLPQAISSLSAAASIAKTMVGIRDETLINTKVIDLQGHIIDAQSKVLAAQEVQADTSKKIDALERELTRLNDWSAERQNYELKEIGGSVFAYVRKDLGMADFGNAQKFCCNCFEKGIKSTLQRRLHTAGRTVHLVCQNGCGEVSFTHFYPVNFVPGTSAG